MWEAELRLRVHSRFQYGTLSLFFSCSACHQSSAPISDLVAGLLLVWTLRSLGKNLTDTVVTRKEHTLVIAGPYRWVRHPFYCSVWLAVLANSLAAANFFLLATGTAISVLQVIRTRREEENLLARFGSHYRNYMQNTGRFVPRLPRSS